ncbi:MAG: NADH-quinone oxidoreductase subunit L [Alphaproteobacteria bacterium]|nr:NADH-quinone oxidoreductase subunit L [Alphaproteobacteria bacterium]MCB9796377.1 NADH-quinone oxidoreductase subunit L [Alphaproteobacteria bacterium]
MNPSLLPLIPGLPLLGAVVNGLLRLVGVRLSRQAVGGLATVAVAVPALLSFMALFELIGASSGHGEGHGASLATTLYTWMEVGGFSADIGFMVDPLSAVMMCVITGVGSLIHLYSIGYMDDAADEPSVWRFFAYLNLFIFAMLLLVMGDNFLLMFVGWEGVGVCSYLLIGFWFSDTANAVAGKKAFVTNRVGDFLFILGLFWLFWSLGDQATLNFAELQHLVEANPAVVGGLGGLTVTGVCMLLFGGATGKSAQIPLYVWLPDAMAGPTPVSALIHAATMVTAGIYMVCRLNFLFVLAPAAMGLVALTGALTAFLAATIAITQNDIKKVLAYSTVSQLGYMFMGVGLGAFTAGFFHVITHAFFKALMFLGSGSIIHALHHQQDMRRMGGLRKYMPVTFWTFTAGYLAIIGFPGMSGFFSKDEILWLAFNTPRERLALFGEWVNVPGLVYGLGFITALLTAFYMSRLYFMTFFGEYRGGHDAHDDAHGHGHDHDDHGHHEPHESPAVITIPLVALAILSVAGGLLNLPHWLAEKGWLHEFLHPVVGNAEASLPAFHFPQVYDAVSGTMVGSSGEEFMVMFITLTLIAASVGVAWMLYGNIKADADLADSADPLATASRNKWYVDELYELVLIQPIRFVSRNVLWAVVDALLIDGLVNTAGKAAQGAARGYGRVVQTGRIQGYLLAIALGSVLIAFIYAVG